MARINRTAFACHAVLFVAVFGVSQWWFAAQSQFESSFLEPSSRRPLTGMISMVLAFTASWLLAKWLPFRRPPDGSG